jgi:5,10-methylenetetrahydromethanopterin reductase
VAIAVDVLLNAEYPARDLVQLGRLAEELGYGRLWYTDIRMFRECYLGLAAIAAETKQIALGPGVTDPYSRHPAVTAATIATFDELCGGRALLGLGLGGTGFPELGITRPRPIAALREAVEVMRRLWRGEKFTFLGKVVSLTDGCLQFSPVRDRIPIHIATHGAQIARLAGEVADGVLIANTMVPVAVDFYLRQVHEGAARVGRSIGEIDVSLRPELCISQNGAEAFTAMQRRVAYRLMWTYPHWEYLEYLGVTLAPELAAIAAHKGPRAIEDMVKALPREVVDATVAAGDPEKVAAQIANALRPGITRLAIRAHELPGSGIAPMLRTFIRDVMPRVEKRLSASPRV